MRVSACLWLLVGPLAWAATPEPATPPEGCRTRLPGPARVTRWDPHSGSMTSSAVIERWGGPHVLLVEWDGETQVIELAPGVTERVEPPVFSTDDPWTAEVAPGLWIRLAACAGRGAPAVDDVALTWTADPGAGRLRPHMRSGALDAIGLPDPPEPGAREQILARGLAHAWAQPGSALSDGRAEALAACATGIAPDLPAVFSEPFPDLARRSWLPSSEPQPATVLVLATQHLVPPELLWDPGLTWGCYLDHLDDTVAGQILRARLEQGPASQRRLLADDDGDGRREIDEILAIFR